jgi:transposase-like protein
VKQRTSKSAELRRHRTPKAKARILKEHERSGLSLLAFARTRGLCYASLRRWRSRPCARVPEPPAHTPGRCGAPRTRSRPCARVPEPPAHTPGRCGAPRTRSRPCARVPAPPAPQADPRFVPVTVEGEVSGGDYVLNLVGGRSLRIPLRFEPDSLRRLLAVLEGVQ